MKIKKKFERTIFEYSVGITQLGKAADESASSEEGERGGELGGGGGRCAHISTEGSALSVDELTFEQIIDNEIGLVQKLHHSNIIKINEVRSSKWGRRKAAAGGWPGWARPLPAGRLRAR